MTTVSQTPWLSVLMPVYNGSATLRASLESLTKQQDGIELLIVDQDSTDDSVAIALSFQDQLDIKFFSASENKSWTQNVNLALRHALGHHATILHQDDIWLPGRIELLQGFITRHPNASLYVHNARYIDGNGRDLGKIGPPFGRKECLLTSEAVLCSLLVQNTFSLPSVMFKTDVARKVGGLDESLWYTADWEFWLRLSQQGPLAWSPLSLCGFRLHGSSLTIQGSRNLESFKQQLVTAVERHKDAAPIDQRNRIERAAKVSIALNVWLASAFHGRNDALLPLLRSILDMGPIETWRFLKQTQILHRVLPRLRTLAYPRKR